MVSLTNTNYGFSLAALRSVNAEINQTQNRIATGYKVASAKDNASVWATAVKLRGDINVNEGAKSGLATAKAQADTGLAALDEVSTLVDEISKVVAQAKTQTTASDSQIATVVGYTNQIKALLDSATYGSANLLKTGTATAVMPYSDGASGGSLTYTGTDLQTDTGAIKDLIAATTSSLVKAIDTGALYEQIATRAANLSSLSKAADSAMNFADKLADIQSTALSSLVDADLERESARMQALQVRQQLAYQAMSMTSNSAQNVLMLFR